MTVLRDLMTTRVATTSPDTSIAVAAAGMVEAKVGSVVVIQGSFLAGILTERVLRAAASGQDLSASQVSEWMTPDPHAASPDTTAEEPLRCACQRRYVVKQRPGSNHPDARVKVRVSLLYSEDTSKSFPESGGGWP
jgi:predicted transcriptional regulator